MSLQCVAGDLDGARVRPHPSWRADPPAGIPGGVEPGCADMTRVIPDEPARGYDVMAIIRGLIPKQ